ncbi:Transcription factor COE1 [Dionaea muscipula]
MEMEPENNESLGYEACCHCRFMHGSSLMAIAKGCPSLKLLWSKDCPLIRDQGVASLVLSPPSSVVVLAKVKLQGLNDINLEAIGNGCPSLKQLWLLCRLKVASKAESLGLVKCFGVRDICAVFISHAFLPPYWQSLAVVVGWLAHR